MVKASSLVREWSSIISKNMNCHIFLICYYVKNLYIDSHFHEKYKPLNYVAYIFGRTKSQSLTNFQQEICWEVNYQLGRSAILLLNTGC